MKTVVISGYYGYENIGDEALLAAMVSALRTELPDLKIIVLSASPGKTRMRYQVESVSRLSLPAVLRALKGADLLISGGGSLLQDVTGLLTIPYYLGIAVMAKMMGKTVMFYAQGIGPVSGWLGKMLIKLIVNRVNMITLRDSASESVLRDMGVFKPPIEVTADPVFGLDIEKTVEAGELFKSLNLKLTGKPVVGVFVREWKGLTGFKKAIAQWADDMYNLGWEVMFVPMQHPHDVLPGGDIVKMMQHRPLVIERALNLSQLVAIINSLDMVIGMRLHALILAAICEVPMVGISYDPKVNEFLDSIGQPMIENLDFVAATQLMQMVTGLITDRAAVKQKLFELKTGLRQKALRNSQIAVQLLTKPDS